MGIFNKEFCSICGNPIGLINTVRLSDAKICKKCYSLKSEWFELDNKTVPLFYFQKHLKKREENLAKYEQFQVTRIVGEDRKICIDENNQSFYIMLEESGSNYIPDVFSLSDVIGYHSEIKKNLYEIKIHDRQFNSYSFTPPCYNVVFNFYVTFNFADDQIKTIQLPLGTASVYQTTVINVESVVIARMMSKKPYREYRGRLTNEEEVKNSEQYIKYSYYIEQLDYIFGMNTEKKIEDDKQHTLPDSRKPNTEIPQKSSLFPDAEWFLNYLSFSSCNNGIQLFEERRSLSNLQPDQAPRQDDVIKKNEVREYINDKSFALTIATHNNCGDGSRIESPIPIKIPYEQAKTGAREMIIMKDSSGNEIYSWINVPYGVINKQILRMNCREHLLYVVVNIDIPQEKRYERDNLRKALKQLSYDMLQIDNAPENNKWTLGEYGKKRVKTEKKITLVNMLLVPETIEEQMELFMMCISNIDVEYGKKRWSNTTGIPEYDYARAWINKMEQVYTKASLLHPKDPLFKEMKELYDNKMSELKYKKKR